MRLWVEDLKFHLARSLRVVGIAIAVVAWTSVLGSEAQWSSDLRILAIVGGAILAVVIGHLFTGLPPSSTVVSLLRSMERDIVSAARERAGGDSERLENLIARISALAAVRINRSGNLPRDRRAWLRALAGLATHG